jgi:hypothetical protein
MRRGLMGRLRSAKPGFKPASHSEPTLNLRLRNAHSKRHFAWPPSVPSEVRRFAPRLPLIVELLLSSHLSW